MYNEIDSVNSRRNLPIGSVAEIVKSYPCINFDTIKELWELDATGNLFSQLIAIFKSEISSRLPQMKANIQDQDYKKLAEITHRFRSTAYNLGATRAAELTKTIDSMIFKDDSTDADFLLILGALSDECQKANIILTREVQAKT